VVGGQECPVGRIEMCGGRAGMLSGQDRNVWLGAGMSSG
jgi:hypothetical protein